MVDPAEVRMSQILVSLSSAVSAAAEITLRIEFLWILHRLPQYPV